jgi:hypothetical protein
MSNVDRACSPTESVIRMALRAAVSPLPNQAPAVTCAVVLRGMTSSLFGALSETPEGGLRLLSPNGPPVAGARVTSMIEQFFNYEDVLVFGIVREVKTESYPLLGGRDSVLG